MATLSGDNLTAATFAGTVIVGVGAAAGVVVVPALGHQSVGAADVKTCVVSAVRAAGVGTSSELKNIIAADADTAVVDLCTTAQAVGAHRLSDTRATHLMARVVVLAV